MDRWLLRLCPPRCAFPPLLLQRPPSNRQFPPGHAGAILQARQLGSELLVGVHSDEAILENKGPTVMTLKERSVHALLLGLRLLTPAPALLP